ncbi:molybdopterin synthase sulfur carrier subunit [Vibrio breoganii]|uniref:Molybdopterin synthase sulfur carrier subunit n=1 Tax=Vibrio breoganii TaxID=553239 RepID=A0AAJ5EHN0_9VIBR|nr:molybdopterin synthase sulfur carrier subunit [Vibrio breoganii]ANO32442.1 molybdopterin synthase sulfur carrier subunit [Vibrio breoganii]MDN3717945.1 molybdopterin synthase sulfur carrier subunit [Vibrio breoganii]NMO75329.1 molybdopterin synthase sulfur carrier subunit [Vibrio breoganii]NMR71866.1 molybdopterin synthase sulfur carrier subunit [Vibrio breoganii]OCH76679.1 molybdopterin synthase sulfur carrier subunit [Vibrio breoganii]
MIKVVFFAQVRELVGEDEVTIDSTSTSVDAIRQQLIERGDKWALALESGKLLAAVNHTMVPLDSTVKSGDEVAFFPPVTGG